MHLVLTKGLGPVDRIGADGVEAIVGVDHGSAAVALTLPVRPPTYATGREPLIASAL